MEYNLCYDIQAKKPMQKESQSIEIVKIIENKLKTSSTVRVDSLPNRKWKETKQEPGTAGTDNMLGCCLISFHFLRGKLSTRTVL